jgi:aryl-phospho-beta-D-glucosidase BglC (GH1 family)
MFVLVIIIIAALLLYWFWRAELAIQVPWIPDEDSRRFAERPLPPPREDLNITRYDLPLQTRGRHVVDQKGRRFKLASVNWYGASDESFVVGGLDVRHRDDFARTIRTMGFNSVRLPYSDELVMANPVIDPKLLAANADLVGMRAMDVFTAVVRSLTSQGVAVIVNNHITSAQWCCGIDPCDAGWANDHLGGLCRVKQTEEEWIRHWEAIMAPLADDPFVIGVDLRNEVRGLWGTMPWETWAAAAERCGKRLHAMSRDWLIVVGGTESGNDLSGVARRPVVVDVPDKVVYSSHVYGWSGWGSREGRFVKRPYASFARTMRQNWGYLLDGDVAPVWCGEFGAPHMPNVGDAHYWENLMRYLKMQDADFGYWAINPRKPPNNEEETYGLVEDDWETIVLDYRMKDMVELMNIGLEDERERDL